MQHSSSRFWSGCAASALLLALTACGGGGGSSTPTYTIGGTVTGLPASASAVLQDNAGDNLTISANGTFTFATALDSGAAYAATVLTQPTGATCTVTSGSGTVASANVTNISVTCSTVPTYTIGGTVTGLPASESVVLQDNGADNLTLSANGAFTFATPLISGATYAVTVKTQPSGGTCTVTAGTGTGTVATAPITTVAVTCTAASTATTGSTAFSALSVGNARIALVPLNLWDSANTSHGVIPLAIDGTTTINTTGAAFVTTSFPIQACSTDSTNLVAVCINYTLPTIAVLNLATFSTTFKVSDIVETEFDTGTGSLPQTTFSGVTCTVCGVVTVPKSQTFAISAGDGYHLYAYPAAGATSPLTPTKVYTMPITENFTLSNTHNWLISPDYNPTGTGTRALRLIDLTAQVAYTWTNFTDLCATTDPAACTAFSGEEVDSASFADDTGLLYLDSEGGDAQLTVDLSQAVFNATAGTFTAPYSYVAIPSVGVDMSGILASSIGHWGYTVAEFGDAIIGVQQVPSAGGTGGTFTEPTPTPIFLDLTALSSYAPCTMAPVGGEDPHAQGYTITSAGVPVGLFVSGDSSCVAVINFALLYAAPRQAGANSYLVDTTSYNPITSGAVTFYAVPAE